MTEELWVSPSATGSNGWHLVTAVPGDEDQTTICGLPVEVDASVYTRFPDHPAVCSTCQAAREIEFEEASPETIRVGNVVRRPQDLTSWKIIHITSRWVYAYDVNDPDDVAEFSSDMRFMINT